jgi:hypothetical protein
MQAPSVGTKTYYSYDQTAQSLHEHFMSEN